MAYKRVYLGVVITTIIGLFAYLATLGLVITSDGNKDCNFVYNDVTYCTSYINVTNPKVFSVDIYNREEIKLDFTPEIKNYYLFSKDGRCSGKKGSECCTYDNICIKGWRYLNFTDATKPRNDRVYVFRYAAYSTTQHLLLGEKNKLYEEVKWTLGVGGGELDPIWNGIDINHKLISTYSSLTEYRLRFSVTIDKTTELIGNYKPKTDYQVVNGKIPTTNQMFLIENISSQVPIYTTEDYNCDVVEKNGTIVKQMCKRYVQTGTQTSYHEKKTEYKGTSFEAGKEYVFEVVVNKKPERGQVNIDVVPEILEYRFPYAWWNTSFNRCKDILIQEDYKSRTDFPLEINLTGLTFSSTNELRIVNASCNDDGGVEIPFDILSNGATFANVLFLTNTTLGSNVTYSIYYDASGMSAPTYTTDITFTNGTNIYLGNNKINLTINDTSALVADLFNGTNDWVESSNGRKIANVANYTHSIFADNNPKSDCEINKNGYVMKSLNCVYNPDKTQTMEYRMYAGSKWYETRVNVYMNYSVYAIYITPGGQKVANSFNMTGNNNGTVPTSWTFYTVTEGWKTIWYTTAPQGFMMLLWNFTNASTNSASISADSNGVATLLGVTGVTTLGQTRIFIGEQRFYTGIIDGRNASDYYKWLYVVPLKTYLGTEEAQIQVCQEITTAGFYQILGDTVATKDYCINISTSDVIFDCNNNMIDGNKQTYGYLIYARNYSAELGNVTIRNCKVNASEINSEAVTMYNVTNGTLKDINVTNSFNGIILWYSERLNISNISTVNNRGLGIELYETDNSNISNVDIRYNGVSDHAFEIYNGNSNTVNGIVVWQARMSGVYVYGNDNNLTNMYIRSTENYGVDITSANRTFVSGVTIFNSSFKATYPAVRVINSQNVTFINANITGSNYDGIYVTAQAGNRVQNIHFQNITIINTSSTRYDFIADGNTHNITFSNSSYSYLKESVAVPVNVTRLYFYKAYVYDLAGNAKNAVNVTVTNNTGKAVYSVLTGADGWTAQTVLTDYYIRSGIRIMSSNYTATASNTTHAATDVFNSTVIGTSRNSMLLLSKLSTINVTIKLNGGTQNLFYEVGTKVNITINTTNSSVAACILVNMPGFTEQCSLGNLSYNWTSYVLEFRLKDGESESNKTIGSDTWTFRLYSKDDISSFTFWLTGYNVSNYPRNTKVDVADNEDIDYIVYGDLIGNNAYIDKFKDETSASLSYSLTTAGGFVKYIRMPSNFTLSNFSISATGSSTDKHEVNFSKIMYASTGYNFAEEHGIKAMKLFNSSLYLLMTECTSAITNPQCNVYVKKYNILTNTIVWTVPIETDLTNGDNYAYAIAVNNNFVYASAPANFSFFQIFEVNGSLKNYSYSIDDNRMYWAKADDSYFVSAGDNEISVRHADNMSYICSFYETATAASTVFDITFDNTSTNYVYAITQNSTSPPTATQYNIIKIGKSNCSLIWRTSIVGVYGWVGRNIQVDANKIYATGHNSSVNTNWILWKNNGTTIMAIHNGIDIRENSLTMDTDNLYTTYPNQTWYSIARLSKVNMSIMELNYSGIASKQAGVVIHNNSMFYVAEAYWANSSNSVRIWSMEKNTPTNVKIDIGNDGINDFNKSGKLTAVGMARNLTAVTDYAANHCSGITCDVPVRFLSESAGKFTITANVTYSPNPITINLSVVQKYTDNSIEYNKTILTDTSAMTIKSVETNGTFIWTRDYQVTSNISEFWMNGSMKREMKFTRGNSTYGCIMHNGTNFLILGTDDPTNAGPYTIYVYNNTMGYLNYNLTSGLAYIPTGGCELTSNYIYIMTSDEYVRKYHAANGSYISRISATGSGVFSDDTYIWTIDPLIDSPDCKQYYIYKYWANGTLIDKLIIRGGGETFYQLVDGVLQGDIMYLGTGQKVYSYSINNDFSNMSVNMTSDGSGALNMNTIRINYSGSQNVTIFGYEQGSTTNVSIIAKLIYSKMSAIKPYTYTDSILIFPTNETEDNVTPYGQSNDIPFYNITGDAYDQNMNITIRSNASLNGCMNVTIGTTNMSGTTYNGTTFNTNYFLYTNLTKTGNVGIWMWFHFYGCNATVIQSSMRKIWVDSWCYNCAVRDI